MFQYGAGREVLGFYVLSNEHGATLGPLDSFGNLTIISVPTVFMYDVLGSEIKPMQACRAF